MQKRTKNGGYESFSADPVLYRWQCWASSQGVGNSALGGMVCYPYPMDRDYSSSENPTIHHQEVSEVVVVTHSQCSEICCVIYFFLLCPTTTPTVALILHSQPRIRLKGPLSPAISNNLQK